MQNLPSLLSVCGDLGFESLNAGKPLFAPQASNKFYRDEFII
jgi:hypothetical protein